MATDATKDLNIVNATDIQSDGNVELQRPPLHSVSDDDIEIEVVANAKDEQKEKKDYKNVIPAKRRYNEIDEINIIEDNLSKKAKLSVGGQMYEYEKIIGRRDSQRRSGQFEYLIHWKNYPLYQSSWHHEENFNNKRDITVYDSLSNKEKRKRFKSFKQSWTRYNSSMTKPLCCNQATQTSKDEDSSTESEDIEIIYPKCKGEKEHWEKVKDSLQELHGLTHFALISSPKVIKNFIKLIMNTSLYLKQHEYCGKELNDIKVNLKHVYDYLNEQPLILTQMDEDGISDAETIKSESEARSKDSRSVGTESDQELTDKEDIMPGDDDYDPINDPTNDPTNDD